MKLLEHLRYKIKQKLEAYADDIAARWWATCPECKRHRWVEVTHEDIADGCKPDSLLCLDCMEKLYPLSREDVLSAMHDYDVKTGRAVDIGHKSKKNYGGN